jgi:hypothetical protein
MRRPMDSLQTALKQRLVREFGLDNFGFQSPLTLEEKLERRRSELKNGLTDMQRLFLFGKLSGLNDKDAALAAGYSLSVAENTKQRIWKPQVRTEFERVCHELAGGITTEKPLVDAPRQTPRSETEESAWR